MSDRMEYQVVLQKDGIFDTYKSASLFADSDDDAIDKASHRVKVKRFVSLVGGEVAFAGFEDGVCVLADKVALSAA